ncbi:MULTISPECIES: ArgS-related anticodon-binding protein NrtL [unclassified Streptomyces]|uniref:ArgS-related anticodon-binding protein NrtL n=1 Tax=unclassified Streptomyces TaxID=2593676 RepID=UPI00093C84D1|nr:DALR anticodon-binding domain-containing protein [Streptomyces sp. CB01883]OKJ86999.1 arginyl-tRNA synthetase [Streptomyces sp. CB01883]
MTPVELSRTVLHAVRRAVDGGELDVTVPERAVVTEPGPGGCGDFSTTIALQLARPAGQPPRRVAEILRPHLADADGVRDVVVTGPGFLNISLDDQADVLTALVREIRSRGAEYGHGDALAGEVVALRVPYEVRAEVVADAVVRIVATQGGRATVEHGEPVNLRPVPAPEDPAPLGPDAAQWALLHPAPHDRPRITADHLVQREGNPLFRVRYAHARIRSLSRNAARLGFTAEPGPLHEPTSQVSTSLVSTSLVSTGHEPTGQESAGQHEPTGHESAGHQPTAHGDAHFGHGAGRPYGGPLGPSADTAPAADVDTGTEAQDVDTGTEAQEAGAQEAEAQSGGAPRRTPVTTPPPPLQTPLADHPRVLALAATQRAPDRLARHLVTVADAVLPFLPCVLPRGEEKPSAAHRARLALAEAAGTVLAGGLSLLGIDAPEHL